MEYPSNRVNWSSIFSCALMGTGAALLLSMVARSANMALLPEGTVITAQNPGPLPFGWLDAIAAVVVMGVSFGAAGFASSVLARFPTRLEGVLHAFAGFMLAALAIHFMARGALFAARPGFPWDLAIQREFTAGRNFQYNAFVSWTSVVSVLFGLAACCAGASAGFHWLAHGRFRSAATRRDNSRRAA